MERGAPRYTLENHYSPQTATNETHYRLRYGTNVMIPVEVEEPLTGRPLFQQKQNTNRNNGYPVQKENKYELKVNIHNLSKNKE